MEFDDLILSALYILITNLNREQCLTEIVRYYFEITSFIVDNDLNHYQGIIFEIRQCLEYHGWNRKDNLSRGKFQFTPERSNLALDLQKITNKYF